MKKSVAIFLMVLCIVVTITVAVLTIVFADLFWLKYVCLFVAFMSIDGFFMLKRKIQHDDKIKRNALAQEEQIHQDSVADTYNTNVSEVKNQPEQNAEEQDVAKDENKQ